MHINYVFIHNKVFSSSFEGLKGRKKILADLSKQSQNVNNMPNGKWVSNLMIRWFGRVSVLKCNFGKTKSIEVFNSLKIRGRLLNLYCKRFWCHCTGDSGAWCHHWCYWWWKTLEFSRFSEATEFKHTTEYFCNKQTMINSSEQNHTFTRVTTESHAK